MRPTVSVVIPMRDEADNARETLCALATTLGERGWTFELIPVDDGSTDGTDRILSGIAAEDPAVRAVSYRVNRGRGYALRRGFAEARGDYVVSMDADLSYTPDHAVRMVELLQEEAEADIVLASPYMPGGRVEGVGFARLVLSRVGNLVLRAVLPRPVHTATGLVRAYRRDALAALDLESDGKEIHLEILSDAFALGLRVIEMPSTLRARQKGHSKFRPRATVTSHLLFSVLARPASLFGLFGAALLLAGLGVGIYLFCQYLTGDLHPERPLMTVMVLFLLGGIGALAFAVLASQLIELRRAVVRLQADVTRMRRSTAHRAADDGE